MRMKWAYLLLLLFPLQLYAEEFNAGFVQGLWYSQEKIFVNEPVRIYVAIRNNTGSDLTGTVEFFDGGTRINKKTVQALDGRIIESWADWSPTHGTHTVSANLTRIELSKVGSSTQTVEVTSALAKDILFVDYDTDKDGSGNMEDKDDDGDTITDVQEKSTGTDPLIKNVTEEKKELKEEKMDVQEDAKDTQETKTISNNPADSNPEGLEHFLSESPAENVLSGVTTFINSTKQNLDTYRTDRKTKLEAQEPTVNADGFGEITRTTDGEANQSESPKVSGDSFFDKAFGVAGKIFNGIFTTILAILSFVLAHPMFVQLGILILILFLLIKFAAKFGKRPKNYR